MNVAEFAADVQMKEKVTLSGLPLMTCRMTSHVGLTEQAEEGEWPRLMIGLGLSGLHRGLLSEWSQAERPDYPCYPCKICHERTSYRRHWALIISPLCISEHSVHSEHQRTPPAPTYHPCFLFLLSLFSQWGSEARHPKTKGWIALWIKHWIKLEVCTMKGSSM